MSQRDVAAELRGHHDFGNTQLRGGGSDFADALEQAQIKTKRHRNQLFTAESKADAAREFNDDLKRQQAEAGWACARFLLFQGTAVNCFQSRRNRLEDVVSEVKVIVWFQVHSEGLTV